LKDRDEVIGNLTRVKVVKNKVAPPFRVVEFDILYGEGISKTGELIDLGVKGDIVSRNRVAGIAMVLSASVKVRKMPVNS
jgi:recombination protein RecA